ncbi:MAG: LssY C-terminal domain-containing protein [bacterium]|nr:LssY C-terminal domain-containing protein [bacterium]
MLIRIVRLLKRLVVLVIGIAIVYLAVWQFYPFFDNQVPWAIALFITYVFTAYFFIPLIIRFIRIIVRPKHLPTYCVTPDGFASDPVNIGIVGTRKQIISAMEKSGWHTAHKRTLLTLYRMGRAILTRRQYLNAPFSSLYLFGRRQDLGFQKPIENNPSHRHHVRFWACHLEGPEAFHKDVAFWQRFHRPNKDRRSRQLWVGAASRDVGIMPIRHNAQLTHMIDPDTNAERDMIVEDLRNSHSVSKTLTEKVHEGLSLRNRVLRGVLHADGKIRICILKD